MIVNDSHNTYLSSSLINSDTFFSGFTTRKAGDGRDKNNRLLFLKQFGNSFIIPKQTHSVNVHIQEKPLKNEVMLVDNIDGLITNQSDTLLSIITADCVPIIYADKNKNIIGVSHQGWKGTYSNLTKVMIDNMKSLGGNAKDLHVAIGPAIGGCCYEIYGERLDLFNSTFSQFMSEIVINSGKKSYLDLPKLNYLLLLENGVQKDHIDFRPFCTKCDKDRFFSYQRDDKIEYKEMISFIVMK